MLAREAVISEMQNRGNEILAEVGADTESYFYSAQRCVFDNFNFKVL